MKFIIDIYRLLAGKDLTPADEQTAEGDRVLGRRAASRYSRGNVAIQFNSFITTSDLEKERREVAKLNFRN